VHLPSGATASPTLLSPERYKWLYTQHTKHSTTTNFTQELTKLLQRYHPVTTRLTPQGTTFKIANQRAPPRCLTAAIHATFDTSCELFASPLNSSMNPNVSYCAAHQEDATFGAQDQAYSYRWTGLCLAVPEHEPANTRKAVLHTLACSTATESPLLVVMMLPAWEDAPWRTHSILSHPNVTTLVQLKPNQLKLITANEQPETNLNITLLRAADHPIDVVVIATTEGRKAHLHLARLHYILISGILQACQDTYQTINIFPTPTPQTLTPAPSLHPPIRPLPNARLQNTPQCTQQPGRPPTHNPTHLVKEDPQHPPLLETTWPREPTIQHIKQHILPLRPLAVLKFSEGTTTGLEALLKVGYHIGTYAWSHTNPDAHTAGTHRL
jgi:hypothetical protein